MTKVVDKGSQQEVEVAPEEAQRGLQRGEFVLPKSGGPVQLTRGNEAGEVAPQDLAAALAQGWQMASPEQQEQAKLRAEESDIASQALAFGESAASGLTLGLSTMAEEALGVDMERARVRREQLGAGGTLAELAGGIVGTIGTGGAGLAARGATSAGRLGALATDVGLASRGLGKIGGAVERGVTRALGDGTTAARVFAPTARGMVEGFGAGVGAQIDESTLGDRELVAEQLMASGLSATILGGGIGLGAGAGGLAARTIADGTTDAMRKVLGRASGAPGGMVSREVAEDALETATLRERAADLAGDVGSRASSLLAGARPDVARRAFREAVLEPKRVTDLLSRRSQIEEAAAQVVQRDLRQVMGALEDARISAGGASKYRRIAKEFTAAEDAAARRYAPLQRQKISSMLDEAELRNSQTGFRSYDPNTLSEIRDLTARMEAEIGDDAASAFSALDRYKRDLGLVVNRTGGFSGKPKFGASSDLVQSNALARKVYADVQDLLLNKGVFGERATALQRGYNDTYSKSANAISAFTDEAKGSGVSRVFHPDGTVNMNEALRLVRQSNRAGGDAVVSELENVLDSQLEHLDFIAANYDLPTETASKIAKARESVQSIKSTMQQQAKDAGALQDLLELRGAEGGGSVSIGIGSNLGTAVGGLIGGTVIGGLFGEGGQGIGAVLGAGLGLGARPYTAARGLASILALAERAGARLDTPVSSFTRRVTGQPAKTGARGFSLAIPGVLGLREKSREDRNDVADRVARDVAFASASPTELVDRVTRATMEMDDLAPALQSQISQSMQRAALFLRSKTPPSYTPPLTGAPPMIDNVSRAQFSRYVEGALDPESTLGRLEDGTLSVEHVEALRVCWPKLYRQTQEKIMLGLQEAIGTGREVSTQDRLSAGILLDLPTDPGLQPQLLAQIQAAQAGAVAQANAGQSAANTQTIRKGNPPNRAETVASMTPAERIETGAVMV